MTTPGQPNDILLEAGTNEFEVLVFRLGDGLFGVNVAKVREVVRWQPLSETPHRHASVLGMINLRGQVIGVVELKKHLGIGDIDPDHRDTRVIVTEFNGIRTGFAVDHVEQIHRVAWSLVKRAPDFDHLHGSHAVTASSCTGMIELDDKLVLMIDFESVADAILNEERLHLDGVDNDLGVDRASHKVLIAEDSPFMRDLMQKVFLASGYAQAEFYEDGLSAWNRLSQLEADGVEVAAVVSDIEMPQIDGLNLCRRIKSSSGTLQNARVVLFSSLISADNLKKGEQVGADAQVAKPDLADTVRLVDRVIAGERIESARAA
ncbi:MAG: chemotaxis protein [Planctomycetota bacterium]